MRYSRAINSTRALLAAIERMNSKEVKMEVSIYVAGTTERDVRYPLRSHWIMKTCTALPLTASISSASVSEKLTAALVLCIVRTQDFIITLST